jgi:hypothetical protein
MGNAPESYDVEMTVLEIVPGKEAWERIKAQDMCNEPSKAGFEYILVRMKSSLQYTVIGWIKWGSTIERILSNGPLQYNPVVSYVTRPLFFDPIANSVRLRRSSVSILWKPFWDMENLPGLIRRGNLTP